VAGKRIIVLNNKPFHKGTLTTKNKGCSCPDL
jgi:hypothetical protein